jgi:enediyne biosynthesis protein E4
VKILRLLLLPCLTLPAEGPSWTVLTLPMRLATGETARKPLPATMPGGLAVLDYDGDGRLDLFFTNGGDLPVGRKTRPGHANQLFHNLGGTRFEDVTARAGVAGTDYSFGVTAADYDGDGRIDLLVTGLHGVTLYRNRGDGTFADATAAAGLARSGGWAVAAAWFDKDNDGDLDLFIVHYVVWDPATERACVVDGKPDFCHPKFYPATTNALFENRGDGTFVDVSAASGIAKHPGKGMSVAVADFNGDGFTDLFVTNDRVFNSLFLNRGGKTFDEAAFESNVAAPSDGNPPSSMGVDAQDFDGDGRPDLIYTALRDETFPTYRNTGQGFAEVTAPSRMSVLTRPMAGWGIVFADLDNDGRPDIVAARSDVLSASGAKGATAKEPPSWFRNLGAGKFALGTGWEQAPRAMWRGALAADLDNDGCQDVVLTALEAAPHILRNPCAGGAHWLQVDVRQPGARVRAGAQWRVVSSAAGYASSYAGPQHFGLGAATEAEVEVVWPGGKKKVLPAVRADRKVRVEP